MSVIQECEQAAARVLARVGSEQIPVNVEEVADSLGVGVEGLYLGDEISGMLLLDGPVARIGVNLNHPEVRRRFTVSHEIGHFVLHQGIQRLFIDQKHPMVFRRKRPDSKYDRREVEANAFAAALLMPERQLKSAVKRSGFDLADETSLSSLATTFNVSQSAMTYRIANLSLFADFQPDAQL